jgi:hypothetical protein
LPLSDDPGLRARQLANLKRGDNPAPAGNGYAIVHGENTARPHAGPEWSPAVRDAMVDLESRVGGELRDAAGDVHAWARPSVEAVAIQRVACWRFDRYVADREARGLLTRDDLDGQSRVAERYHRALEREALTLRSRIEAAGLAREFDLARELSRLDGEVHGA